MRCGGSSRIGPSAALVRMDVEVCGAVICRRHHRRRRGDDRQPATLSDVTMPCMITARSPSRRSPRINHVPLISAVPTRSKSATAGRSFSMTLWCSAMIQLARGY
jgi:hypothetical protein